MTSDEFRTDILSLLARLSPREQRKALAGAMRREANRLKKAAQAAVKRSGLGQKNPTRVERGVYSRVYPARYGAGFLVSVKPHGAKKGIHRNRYGREKPVLMFAEEGTVERNVGRRQGHYTMQGGRFASKKYRTYKRSGHSTGRMRAYHFLAQTEQTEATGIEQRLFTEFEKNVSRAADQ